MLLEDCLTVHLDRMVHLKRTVSIVCNVSFSFVLFMSTTITLMSQQCFSHLSASHKVGKYFATTTKGEGEQRGTPHYPMGVISANSGGKADLHEPP